MKRILTIGTATTSAPAATTGAECIVGVRKVERENFEAAMSNLVGAGDLVGIEGDVAVRFDESGECLQAQRL